MKRTIGLSLAIIMLISFIPIKGEGANYFKDIDVIFGDFKLNVNGKKISNHKEPFLYDGNFYVSLSDLAKGLELDIEINGNTILLNSNNKLNIESYNSNLPLVFQKGYEVLAKEKQIEELEDEVNVLEGKSTGKINYEIKSTIKNIRVGFGNISIFLDGKKLNLDEESFKYNNDIYVSLDSIAPYLYITPNFSKNKTTINIDTNGILASSTSSSINTLLNKRNGKNYLLDSQQSQLERRKEIIKKLKLPYQKITSVQVLENYLNSNLNKINDLELDIKLTQQSNWINLDISFPTSKYSNWYRLTRTDVEGWIWNIYTAIVSLYKEDILINGSIINPYYGKYSSSKYKNYVTFYSKNNDIYFDFTNSNLVASNIINPNYLLEVLNNNLNNYINIDFEYEVSKSGDNIELKVYPNSSRLSKSIYTKAGYLKTLNQRIQTVYPNINVYGQIIYPGDIEPLDFYISKNRVRSKDLLDETMEYINDGFGYLYTGIYGFRLKYSIYELDLMNFRLIVEGDFSVEEDRWNNDGDLLKGRLYTAVNHVISTISSLWDANLTVDVMDKNGVSISEYTLYQESVSLISADPSGGLVSQGDKIYLYSATPGVKIYYTTDGTTPTESSSLYDGNGIPITRSITIKAIGYKEGLNPSPVSTFNYTVGNVIDLSQGLANLVLSEGSLNPPFSQSVLNYTVNVNKGLDSISITPYATYGAIKVNGDIVTSGQSKEITLNSDSTTVTIEVKENNKLEKVYNIIINKES